MSVNINDINTVDDLLKVQQTPEEVHTSNVKDHIIEQILAEDPSIGLEIANHLVYALRELHAVHTESLIEKGEAGFAAKWSEDTNKLDIALRLLKEIQLWVFRNK